MTSDQSVFKNTNITETDLLGKHVYKDVLYTGADVKNKCGYYYTVEDSPFNYPCVATKTNPEGPYAGEAGHEIFFNHSITGLEYHKVFKNAVDSDAYNVTHEADYSTGTLVIEVTKN